MSDERKELEEKYYPIYWRIVTDTEDDIEIKYRNGKVIPKKCRIHSMERNFIEEQIQSKLQFMGEIVGI